MLALARLVGTYWGCERYSARGGEGDCQCGRLPSLAQQRAEAPALQRQCSHHCSLSSLQRDCTTAALPLGECQHGEQVVATTSATDQHVHPGLGPAPSIDLSVEYVFVNFVCPEFITNFVQRRVGQGQNNWWALSKDSPVHQLDMELSGVRTSLRHEASFDIPTAPSCGTTLT
jgi:hypothetical protein